MQLEYVCVRESECVCGVVSGGSWGWGVESGNLKGVLLRPEGVCVSECLMVNFTADV